VPDAAEDLELIGFDPHARTAAVTLPAARELDAEGIGGHREAGRQTFNDDGECRSV
jgi:hypothetical protein